DAVKLLSEAADLITTGGGKRLGELSLTNRFDLPGEGAEGLGNAASDDDSDNTGQHDKQPQSSPQGYNDALTQHTSKEREIFQHQHGGDTFPGDHRLNAVVALDQSSPEEPLSRGLRGNDLLDVHFWELVLLERGRARHNPGRVVIEHYIKHVLKVTQASNKGHKRLPRIVCAIEQCKSEVQSPANRCHPPAHVMQQVGLDALDAQVQIKPHDRQYPK